MNIDWELAIASAFLVLMVVLAWKGGRNNPVSTGQLEKDVDERFKKTAKDIHDIKNEMQALEGRFHLSATKKDLGQVSDKVTTVCEKVVGIEKSADRTA